MIPWTYSKKNTRTWLIGLLVVTAYVWHGYQFGQNDQVELLPYATYLNDSNMYSTDLYITYIKEVWPNERWGLAKFISLFPNHHSMICFFAHLACLILLINGLWKVMSLYFDSLWGNFLGVLILLLILYKTNLGGNEIYYNYLVSSVPAKSLGIWAIYYAIRNKWIYVGCIISLITFLQTIVGAQLFLILYGTGLIMLFIQNKSIKGPVSKNFIIGGVLYLLLTGWWILGLLQGGAKGPLSLMELFQFRIPHHFFPSVFDTKDFIILALLLMVSGALFFIKKWNWPLISSGIIILGLIIYTAAVEIFEIEFVLKTQWYKTTIWLEMWSAMSIAFIAERLQRIFFLSKKWLWSILLIGLALIFWFSFNFRSPAYQFPWNESKSTEIKIALEAQSLTDSDAVFIIPFDNTTFKYWSKRNTYVDFKSVLHEPGYLNQWIHRIKEIYNLAIDSKFDTQNKQIKAKQFYEQLEADDLIKIDADFILRSNRIKLNLPILVTNEDWTIYRLE